MNERESLIAVRPIAALFVTKNGTYFDLPGVDPWDEERDARLYEGPHPVVAHPPCNRWSRLAGFVQAVYGHKIGDDGDCFKHALRAVQTYGGILEHPAYSYAWDAFDLPRPTVREGWTLTLDGGASCYVEQGRYGVPVKKATWLYAYGVELPELKWGWFRDGDGKLATNQDPTRGGMHKWRDAWKPEVTDGRWIDGRSRRTSAAEGRQRGSAASRTPIEFRDVLIATARTSFVTSAVAA